MILNLQSLEEVDAESLEYYNQRAEVFRQVIQVGFRVSRAFGSRCGPQRLIFVFPHSVID